jgi:hypothetical protein
MKKRTKTNEKAIIHPTNSQVQRIIKDIRSLRDNGKSDIEIRQTLGLELRTYQKYTHRIHEEDQQIWFSITQEQLATELLRLRSSLEETYKISKDMANDPKCEDRLVALQSKDDARLSIVQLLTDVDMLRKLQVQPSQTVRAYVEKYDWRENGERVLNETE